MRERARGDSRVTRCGRGPLLPGGGQEGSGDIAVKKPKIVLLLLVLALACVTFALRESLRLLVLARPATQAEVQVFLDHPHYLLSPTGWHATPDLTSGYVHRWKAETPVGQWYGYYKNEIAEGWVRSHFDFDGSRVGGFTLFNANGRVQNQWITHQPTWESPPWLWGEEDLTDEEMAFLKAVNPEGSK